MRLIITLLLMSVSNIIIAQQAMNNVENALDSLRIGESEVAFAMLNRSASVNNIVAQYLVARCYEHGIGVSINLSKAFYMYRKTAERGFPQAMADLARCYSDGIGVPVNKEKASQWISRFHSKQILHEIPDIVALHKESHTGYNFAESNYTAAQSESERSENRLYVNQDDLEIKTINESKPIELSLPRKSDVDVDIPTNNIINENVFALIIANENYQDVIPVDYALNDGTIFSQYCHKVLGLPNSNIYLIKDATLNNIKRGINLIQQIANAYKGDASFLIFYAGHGIPDEKTRKSYLMPIDGFVADISTCYGLDELYKVLGVLPAQKVVVFIDACFSGATRGNGMLASARGIAIKAKTNVPQGNTIVISSAHGDETAYPYQEQKHGLFTYFLLKKLKESKGNVPLGTLVDYIKDNTQKKSIVVNGKSQTPTVNPSDSIINEWFNWRLF